MSSPISYVDQQRRDEAPARSGRLLLALVLLMVGLVAAALLLTSLGLAETSALGLLADPVERWLKLGAGSSTLLSRAAVGAGSLLVGVLSLTLALRSVFGAGGGRTVGQQHVLVADERGQVVIDAVGLSKVAAAAARRTPGVTDVRVRVVGMGAAPVRIEARLWVSAAAPLRAIGDDARERVREAVERLVGLDVQDVVARLEVVPLEKLGRIVE